MQALLPSLEHIPRVAVVVPHFESLDCEQPDVPANIQELTRSLQAGRIRPFYAETADLIPGYPDSMQTPTSSSCFLKHPMFAQGNGLVHLEFRNLSPNMLCRCKDNQLSSLA
jgi:hypothetical protein